MKEKVTINDQIANTLFIPLYMRFKESRRPNGIMNLSLIHISEPTRRS